jgi:hypothetical protein
VFWEENLKRLNGNRYRLYAQTDICSRFTNCSNFWEGTFLKYLQMKVTLAPLKSLNLNHIKKIEWQHLRGTNLRWAFSLSTPKLGVRRALYSCEKLYFLRPANWRSPSSLNFGKEHFFKVLWGVCALDRNLAFAALADLVVHSLRLALGAVAPPLSSWMPNYKP